MIKLVVIAALAVVGCKKQDAGEDEGAFGGLDGGVDPQADYN